MTSGYGDLFLCPECCVDAQNWRGDDYQKCKEIQENETVCFTPIGEVKKGGAA